MSYFFEIVAPQCFSSYLFVAPCIEPRTALEIFQLPEKSLSLSILSLSLDRFLHMSIVLDSLSLVFNMAHELVSASADCPCSDKTLCDPIQVQHDREIFGFTSAGGTDCKLT